jgi:hypothetical protein
VPYTNPSAASDLLLEHVNALHVVGPGFDIALRDRPPGELVLFPHISQDL